MTSEERKHRIEAYLQRVEFASLEELSQHVEASVSTVRRDLTTLEASGNLRRTHGGARILTPKTDEFAFTSRDNQQFSEKEAIGKACAELIGQNQSVILDAGTTVYHVARHLEEKAPQIVTNSLPVANLFASANRVEVILAGGVIYPRLGVLVGLFFASTTRSSAANPSRPCADWSRWMRLSPTATRRPAWSPGCANAGWKSSSRQAPAPMAWPMKKFKLNSK